MRTIAAKAIAPIMAVTGYRFSKYHRQNDTLAYRMIDVVAANIAADGYAS